MKNTQNARPELNGLLWNICCQCLDCGMPPSCWLQQRWAKDSQWCDAGEELRLQPLFSSDRETRLQHQQKAAVKWRRWHRGWRRATAWMRTKNDPRVRGKITPIPLKGYVFCHVGWFSCFNWEPQWWRRKPWHRSTHCSAGSLLCSLLWGCGCEAREREDIRSLPGPTVFLMEFISPHSIMQRQGTFPLAYKVPGKWESLDTADSEAVDKSDFFSSPNRQHLHICCLNITSVSTISASKRRVCDGGQTDCVLFSREYK